jgi:hypothetical protein
MPHTAAVPRQDSNQDEVSGSANSQPLPFLYRAAERFGVATVIMLAVLWYVRTDIIKPLLDAHYEFIGKIVEGQEQHTSEIKSVNARLDEMIQIFKGQPNYRQQER